MLKKHFVKILIAIVILLIGGSFYYSNSVSKSANEGVEIKQHIKGNPDARVTLVEYSDFQCPACGQFYPVVKELMEEHGDQVRFEYRHFPLINIHPHAVPAAIASEAASQQGKFFEMHDKLFEGQTVWSKSTNPGAYFVQYAEEIGLDLDLFNKQLNSSLIADTIDASFESARASGYTGTPTFELNGEVMDYSTFAEFRTKIETAIGTTTTMEVDLTIPPEAE